MYIYNNGLTDSNIKYGTGKMWLNRLQKKKQKS